MRTERANGNALSESKKLTIKTSLLEILQALTSQTNDDAR